MSNYEVTPFSFGRGVTIRGLKIEDQGWLLGADIAHSLGFSNPSQAIATHVDPEDRREATLQILEGSRVVARERTLINESGFYALVFGSKLPGAKEFKRWVTGEVLPSLAETGTYSVNRRRTGDLDFLRHMLDEIEADRARIAEVENQQRALESRTAALEENHDRVTAIGWANLRKVRSDVAYLNRLGSRASKIARRDGIEVSRAHSTVWGEVNAWPLEVWDEAHDALGR